jgi:DNA ligase-1
MKSFVTLYNIDSKGKVRIWRAQVDGAKYRTISGLQDGKQVTSEWTTCIAKNVGRANATSAAEQAIAEVEAQYKKKIEKKYSESLEDAGGVKFTECMLAAKWKDIYAKSIKNPKKDGLKWPYWSQPKLDGFRCLGSDSSMLSRGGKQFVAVPHILDAVHDATKLIKGLIFDGELYNHDLRDDFDRLGSLARQMKPTAEDFENSLKYIQYHVYDIASHPGNFEERSQDLADIVREINSPFIKFVETTRCEDLEQLDECYYGRYLPDGYEGQMVRVNAPYEGGRSKSLLKRKEFVDAEYEVVSLEEGKGNWAGYAKAVYFKMPGDQRTKGGDYPKAGIKGSQEFTKKLLNGPKPKTVTVRYPNLTPEGVPRFPIAVDFQYEKGRVW